jgi:hypothetical protein
MDTWVWVVLIVAGVILVAALVAASRGRGKRVDAKRAEAGVLRDRAGVREEQAKRAEEEAEREAREARRRQELAEQRAEEARHERDAARTTATRADEVDPDV